MKLAFNSPQCGHREHGALDTHNVMDCVAYLMGIFFDHSGGALSVGCHPPIGCDLEVVDNSLTQLLPHIRHLRNASLPVMRLPPELLSQIFLMVQTEEVELRRHGIDKGYGAEPFNYSANWIHLTHVCRQWRSVALSCPSLWTHISTTSVYYSNSYDDERFVNPSFIHACLERSQQLPLVVQMRTLLSFDRWYRDPKEIYKALMAHASRFKELYFWDGDSELTVDVLSRLDAPHLETFTTHLDEERGWYPQILSRVNLASVEYLATSFDCHLLALPGPSGNLRQLHLSGSELLSVDTLSTILDYNPYLEDLMLAPTGTITDRLGSPSPSTSAQKPLWKNLRRLALHNPGSEHEPFTTQLLRCIQLPKQHLALTMTGTGLEDTDYFRKPTLYEVLHPTIMESVPLLDITTMNIILTSDSFWLACSGPTVAWYLNSFLAEGLTIFPDLRTLTISLYPHCNAFEHKFARLYNWLKPQSIQDVILRFPCWQFAYGGSLLFLRSLCQPAEDGTTPYAALESMHIHGVHEQSWEALLEMLDTRRSMDLPIQSLSFYISEDLREASLEERETFEEWRLRHIANPLDSVEQVEFRVVPRYPRTKLPPVCAPSERGKWQWFDWRQIGDVQGSLDESDL